ncbi:hypothetical protein EV122DRAFT_285298 [Schizophyllum commune]
MSFDLSSEMLTVEPFLDDLLNTTLISTPFRRRRESLQCGRTQSFDSGGFHPSHFYSLPLSGLSNASTAVPDCHPRHDLWSSSRISKMPADLASDDDPDCIAVALPHPYAPRRPKATVKAEDRRHLLRYLLTSSPSPPLSPPPPDH